MRIRELILGGAVVLAQMLNLFGCQGRPDSISAITLNHVAERNRDGIYVACVRPIGAFANEMIDLPKGSKTLNLQIKILNGFSTPIFLATKGFGSDAIWTWREFSDDPRKPGAGIITESKERFFSGEKHTYVLLSKFSPDWVKWFCMSNYDTEVSLPVSRSTKYVVLELDLGFFMLGDAHLREVKYSKILKVSIKD